MSKSGVLPRSCTILVRYTQIRIGSGASVSGLRSLRAIYAKDGSVTATLWVCNVSSTGLSPLSRSASWSMRSSTIALSKNIQRYVSCSRAIRAGPFASPRPHDRGANAVQSFFATLTRWRLKRGIFHSLVDLEAAINGYLGEHNRKPKSFVWTAGRSVSSPL